MTLTQFESSLFNNHPPTGISLFLIAMWNDAKGNWQTAHEIIQDIETECGNWIHAYLHRKEGDEFNARYWYAKANRKFPTSSLSEEWDAIVTYLLKNAEH
jgi:hypothetical protein